MRGDSARGALLHATPWSRGSEGLSQHVINVTQVPRPFAARAAPGFLEHLFAARHVSLGREKDAERERERERERGR